MHSFHNKKKSEFNDLIILFKIKSKEKLKKTLYIIFYFLKYKIIYKLKTIIQIRKLYN